MTRKATIRDALKRVNREISGHAKRGGHFAAGLASEGYNGGYADALQDCLLFLGGVQPNRHHFWEPVTQPEEKREA